MQMRNFKLVILHFNAKNINPPQIGIALLLNRGIPKHNNPWVPRITKVLVFFRIMFVPICGEILLPLMGMKMVVSCETSLLKNDPSQLETAQKLARECVRKKYKGC